MKSTPNNFLQLIILRVIFRLLMFRHVLTQSHFIPTSKPGTLAPQSRIMLLHHLNSLLTRNDDLVNIAGYHLQLLCQLLEQFCGAVLR